LYDADELFEFQYGDGRTRLIERLAVAYRDGELPDYMLEFVDSLRTRDACLLLSDRKFHPHCASCPQNLSPARRPYSAPKKPFVETAYSSRFGTGPSERFIEALRCREVLR
jgi:hypothetical protein